jgi:hypothetical protein
LITIENKLEVDNITTALPQSTPIKLFQRMMSTFDPSHPYHRPRRLDDYYSYSDETWKQHPHYTITMLIVLGLLLAFIIGYAVYQLRTMDCSDEDGNLIKEVCSFGAADENIGATTGDVERRKRQPLHGQGHPEWSSLSAAKIEMTTSNNRNQAIGSTDGGDYVTMSDVARAVTT